MLAAYAARIDANDPLSALEIGERPDPRAAVRLDDGVGPRGGAEPPRRLVAEGRRAARRPAADDPRLRRRRRRRRRQRGHRPRGGPQRGLDRRRDPRPATDAPVGAPRRDAGRAGRRTGGQRRAEAGGYAVGDGRLPLHGVADGLPDALHQLGRAARRDRPGPGRRRRGGHGAGPAGLGGGVPDVGHLARRGQGCAGGGDRGGPGLRVRRPAARQGRRGHGDRRRGDVDPLDQLPAPGRDASSSAVRPRATRRRRPS